MIFKSINKNKKENQFITEAERRRLESTKRFTPSQTEFFGKKFIIVDALTFLSSLDEIFSREIYKFEFKGRDITIIDCGANVGLASIYFKMEYPSSKIISFEPDPDIFNALKQNITNQGLTNIELRNEAVSIQDKIMNFYSEGGHSGMILEKENSVKNIQVKAIRLKELLKQLPEITFLKIDIEGHEEYVIPDIADELSKVKFMFLEYHSFIDHEQMLDELLLIIRKAGFKYYIKESSNKRLPFIQRELFLKMDLILNIFCYRD